MTSPNRMGCLHAYIGGASMAHGHITALDVSAVRAAPGVVAVLTAADIPGRNDVSPTGLMDEPIFTEALVQFHGQPIFAVVAETRDQARRACALAKIELRAPAPRHRYR
jgi:xanthine dehydrogenase large subunit